MRASLLPAPRLIVLAGGIALGAVGLLFLPAAVPLFVTANLILAGAALLDFLCTPRPRVLRVVRMAPERVGLLSSFEVVLRIASKASVAIRLRLLDTPPPELQIVAGADWAGQVPAQGQVEGSYWVHSCVRGQCIWGPIHVRYGSLWGLWERSLVVPGGQTVRIYPGLALAAT